MPDAEDSSSPPSSLLRTLGWAFYLACSWTWCIGMFLPVLMLRDFGPWSFAAFAAPNVLGAGAMGWVLRRPGAARLLLERHRTAIACFSTITLLQQVMALPVLLGSPPGAPGGPGGWPLAWVLPPLVVALLVGLRRIPLAASAALWAISAGVLAWAYWHGLADLPAPTPQRRPAELWALAPVCVFGFLLCPYLDPTFLKASASQSSRSGVWSFAVGFGVLFLAMILGTLVYARWMLLPTAASPADAGRATLDAIGSWVLALHILPQLALTVILHGRALLELSASPLGARRTQLVFASGLLVTLAIAIVSTLMVDRLAMPAAESCYRLFMAFYGLVFPAYVWLCMVPTADGHSGLREDKLRILALAVGIASPMYWMGFLERQTWWLIPGVGVVLLARALIRPRSTP